MASERTRAERRILHVDVDAMFVRCAVIADPERLQGESLILVGGSPENRGVVTSASYGCRAFGVRSAMPMATAVRLCPDAVVVPVPGDTVRRKSAELAIALRDWSPIAVMASVDEAYLDLTGTEGLYRQESLDSTARRIQADIRVRTGLDVSIGGGTNRLVAKLATSFAKPAGVFIVLPGGEESFVGGLRIEELIGVGPALQEALRRRGVSTMEQLRSLDVTTLASWLGAHRADWLWRRARGIDDSPIATDEEPKSVSSEVTFRSDVDDGDELRKALLTQVVQAAASLRRHGLYARTVTVKLRDYDFRDRSRGRTLPEAIRTDRVIYSVADELLRRLRAQRPTPVRLVGVSLTNLVHSAGGPQSTLEEMAPPLESERDLALARALDRIHARHGKIIGPGTLAYRSAATAALGESPDPPPSATSPPVRLRPPFPS